MLKQTISFQNWYCDLQFDFELDLDLKLWQLKMIKCVNLMSISYRSIYVSILNHSFRGVKFTIFLYFYIVDGGHLGSHSGCYLGNQILLYFQQRNKFNLYSTTVKKIISECTIYSCKRNFFMVKWVIFFKIWPLTINMTLTLTSSMSKTGDKFWLI